MPYVVARIFSGSSDYNPEQLNRMARQDLVPQLLQVPGLLRYSTLQFNDGRVGSFSAYENREAVERGLRVASEWLSSTEAARNYKGAVASCVGIADDASGLVKVVVSGGEVNRCLLGECLAEALPAVDLAHGDLA